jgi:phosphate-selective porin
LCKNTVPKLVVKPKIQTVFKLGHEYEETLTALTKMTQGYYRFKENNVVEIIRNDVDALFATKWLKTTSKYKHDKYTRKVTFDFNFDQYSSKAEFFFDEKYEKIETGTLTSLYFDDET